MNFKTGRTASWGCRGSYIDKDTGDGIVVGCKGETTATTEPIRDITGAVARTVIYDLHTVVEMTLLVPISLALPKIGEKLTCRLTDSNSFSGYVIKSTVQETNQSWRKITVVCEHYYKCDTAYAPASITRYTGDGEAPVADGDLMA